MALHHTLVDKVDNGSVNNYYTVAHTVFMNIRQHKPTSNLLAAVD